MIDNTGKVLEVEVSFRNKTSIMGILTPAKIALFERNIKQDVEFSVTNNIKKLQFSGQFSSISFPKTAAEYLRRMKLAK